MFYRCLIRTCFEEKKQNMFWSYKILVETSVGTWICREIEVKAIAWEMSQKKAEILEGIHFF